jgi:predicted ATP-grasp superfamily ATP-dependent carboligase
LKIFVYEHVTGGGFRGEPLPESMTHEGESMLRALARDLSSIAGIEVVTCRDSRLPPLVFPTVFDFERCMQEADAVWPIAPETGGSLERVSRHILQCGKVLLGSEPGTVRVTASKLQTSRALAQAEIAVAPTFGSEEETPSSSSGWVVKPNDGAGCLNTRFFRSRQEAMRFAQAQGHVLQPYVAGKPCSLSILCRKGEAQLLSCNRQRIRIEDGRFEFLGCEVNSFEDERGDLSRVASRIASTLPGLWGYCGVDFMQTETGPVIIEVNPRLTTSYVGLSDALGENVAGLVLGLLGNR